MNNFHANGNIGTLDLATFVCLGDDGLSEVRWGDLDLGGCTTLEGAVH